MAGHSHSANIKYRKDRQDNARSKLFLKVRKKIENILCEEKGINEKSLSVARENQFPKEKVYQIWEKIKQNQANNSFSSALYQTPFGILIYLENNSNISSNLENQLKLKKLPLSYRASYFQLIYNLKVERNEKKSSLEDYLLTILPEDIWEKINYNDLKNEFSSFDKETMEKLKNIIQQNGLTVEEKKTFWKPLILCQLNTKEEIDYYQKLERSLVGSKYYTNVEK